MRNDEVKKLSYIHHSSLRIHRFFRFRSKGGLSENRAGLEELRFGEFRAFSSLAQVLFSLNVALFGVDASSLVLSDWKTGMGGYRLRFQQKSGDLDVAGGGSSFGQQKP